MNIVTFLKLIMEVIKYKFSINTTKNNQVYKIIFKADDLYGKSSRVMRLDKIIKNEDIKISWGIIGKSLENPKASYIKFLKQKSKDSHYKFFNHGYFHLSGPEYEFYNTSMEEQKNYIKKTQDIVKDKTGIILDTFGAPCNHIDLNTNEALKDFSEIKYWYYGLGENKIVLNRNVEIENGVGKPDFYYFINNWKNVDNVEKVITLQIHPNAWKSIHFLHFKVIIQFLKAQGCEFVNVDDFIGVNK